MQEFLVFPLLQLPAITFLSLVMPLQRKSEIITRTAVDVAWLQHGKR